MEIAGKRLTASLQEQARAERTHLSLTDCNSFAEYVNNPVAAGCEDKRLEIDSELVRQDLWEYPDGSVKDLLYGDERDRVRWIDTSTILADCLTKRPKLKQDKETRQRFIAFMQSGSLSLVATAEAQMKKVYQQATCQKASKKKRAETNREQEALTDGYRKVCQNAFAKTVNARFQ